MSGLAEQVQEILDDPYGGSIVVGNGTREHRHSEPVCAFPGCIWHFPQVEMMFERITALLAEAPETRTDPAPTEYAQYLVARHDLEVGEAGDPPNVLLTEEDGAGDPSADRQPKPSAVTEAMVRLRDRWIAQSANMCDGCVVCDGGRRQMLDHCVQQLDRLLNEAEGGADDA